MAELLTDLQNIFREVFDDDDLTVAPQTTAKDIEGWDSLQHLNLIIAIEDCFQIKFATAEISRLTEEGENIGSLLEIIDGKVHLT